MTAVTVTGQVVTPTGLLDPGVVVFEGDTIIDVSVGGARRATIDAGGYLIMPGLIDVHSDGLEREAQPRPGVELDAAFALGAFEGKVRSAGITTMFHGVAFEENRTWMRSLEIAERSYSAIDARSDEEPAVDHRVLHRLDARDAAALDALTDRLPEVGGLVSFEDHTLGQGQFRDLDHLKRTMADRYPAGTDLDRVIADQIAEREAVADQYERSLTRLSEWALAGRIKLVGHDLVEPEQVERFHALGAAIAEFPCTVDAAEAARARGMPNVAGAPNVLLGGSHSGNVSAEKLVSMGLCDALASDYAPHALLAAALLLARSGATDLVAAVGLITAGPAQAVGLHDRGTLEPGKRADLLVVDAAGPWPRVIGSWRAGERRTS